MQKVEPKFYQLTSFSPWIIYVYNVYKIFSILITFNQRELFFSVVSYLFVFASRSHLKDCPLYKDKPRLIHSKAQYLTRRCITLRYSRDCLKHT